MNERIGKQPVIIENNKINKLDRVLLNSKSFQENWLQELLENEPSILPTGTIDSIFSPIISIAREVETPSGYIDNFFISSKGYLVLVETKLWRNPEARREVVGQIIDYAKDIKEWDYEKINSIYKKYNNTNKSLFSKLVESNYQEEDNEANFIDILEKNIKNSRFLLMIVGDGIREGVERMTEFLNNTPNMQYRLALCELEVYDLEDGKRLVIPQLTTKTSIIERGIIRVEESTGKYIDVSMNEETDNNEKTNNYIHKDKLSFEEWIKKANYNQSANEVINLIQDFEDMGFIYYIGTSDLNMAYYFEPYNTRLKVLMFYGDGKVIAFQPLAYYIFLEKYGYSKTIAEDLFNELKKYLSQNQKNIPYERDNGYYFIDIKTFIDNKDEILQLFEKFKMNF